MGNRLHYHKRHVIDYAGDGFNWATEEIYNLLGEYGCQVYADNTECPEYADEFSVPFEDIEHLIDELKKLDKNKVLISVGGDNDHWKSEYDAEEVLDFFQDAYDNADKDNSDIYFSWF